MRVDLVKGVCMLVLVCSSISVRGPQMLRQNEMGNTLDVSHQPRIVLDTISNGIAYLKSKDLRQAKACLNSCNFEGLGIILFMGQN